MRDETYNKPVLTKDEFGEMLQIAIGDLNHALRRSDVETAKKVAAWFEKLSDEQYPKVQFDVDEKSKGELNE